MVPRLNIECPKIDANALVKVWAWKKGCASHRGEFELASLYKGAMKSYFPISVRGYMLESCGFTLGFSLQSWRVSLEFSSWTSLLSVMGFYFKSVLGYFDHFMSYRPSNLSITNF